MIRAFAGSIALSLVAFACSSAEPSAPIAAASAEAGATSAADAGGPSSTEGDAQTSTSRDAASADTSTKPTGGTCPADIGAFPESEWFHPMHTLTKGSCTAEDLDTLSKIGLGSYAARRAMVSAPCAACVYSDAADAQWGLLIVVDADTALTNYAGCSVLAGDSRACVKQNSAWRFCTRKACSQCPSASRNGCAENESLNGQCKTFYDDDAACGGSWPTGCTSADEMIAKYCG